MLTKSETQGSRFYVKQLYQFRLFSFPEKKCIATPLSKNDCSLFKVYDRRMINKEMWTQKLSGILLNCYYY